MSCITNNQSSVVSQLPNRYIKNKKACLQASKIIYRYISYVKIYAFIESNTDLSYGFFSMVWIRLKNDL